MENKIKRLIKIVSLFFIIIPSMTFADWQLVSPQQAAPSEPFFQGTHRNTVVSPYTRTHHPVLQNRVAHSNKTVIPPSKPTDPLSNLNPPEQRLANLSTPVEQVAPPSKPEMRLTNLSKLAEQRFAKPRQPEEPVANPPKPDERFALHKPEERVVNPNKPGEQVANPRKPEELFANPNKPEGRFANLSKPEERFVTPNKLDERLIRPNKPAAVYAISVSGSVKENLERIMGRYHWKVIWKAPYDYNFDGRVTGTSLPNVVEKLLKPFPLQAVLYMSNRTMTIAPRKA